VDKQRKRGGPYEIAILCFLVAGGFIMTADFAAIDGGPFRYLADTTPWYVASLPLLSAGATLLVWFATRRRLGTWSVGVGYLAGWSLVLLILGPVVHAHFDYVPIGRWLGPSDLQQAERAIGVRIYEHSVSHAGPELIILRDPAVRERLIARLAHPTTAPE
jgi:hypothetical protein